MISVTLQFSTLAAAIAALSALPAETIGTLTAAPSTGSGGTGKVQKLAPAVNGKVTTDVQPQDTAPAVGPAAGAKPASSPKPETEAVAKALEYEADVKPLALKVSAMGREVLIKAWADLGVANGKELKPEQFAGAIEHFTALLAA